MWGTCAFIIACPVKEPASGFWGSGFCGGTTVATPLGAEHLGHGTAINGNFVIQRLGVELGHPGAFGGGFGLIHPHISDNVSMSSHRAFGLYGMQVGQHVLECVYPASARISPWSPLYCLLGLYSFSSMLPPGVRVVIPEIFDNTQFVIPTTPEKLESK